MIFSVGIILATLNFLVAVYTYFTKNDFAHLALASIYVIVAGPIFALFRWRFRRAIRYIPVLLMFGVASYISIGALGINKKMFLGLQDGSE